MEAGHLRVVALAIVCLVAGCGEETNTSLFSNDPNAGDGVQDASLDRTCPVGEERCACYGNATCNTGLVCASDLCVMLPSSRGPDGSSVAGDARVPPFDAGHLEPTDGRAESTGGAGHAGGGHGSGGRAAAGGARAAGGQTAAAGAFGGALPIGTGGSGGSSGGGGDGGTLAAGGSIDAGASGGDGQCYSGEKFCGGVCTPAAPRVGCSLSGCDPCTLTAPANGYITCENGECAFDCLSGYTKSGDTCTGGSTGGTSGNCQPSSCPQTCGVTFGPACCTAAGTCGCPLIPYVAPTCT